MTEVGNMLYSHYLQFTRELRRCTAYVSGALGMLFLGKPLIIQIPCALCGFFAVKQKDLTATVRRRKIKQSVDFQTMKYLLLSLSPLFLLSVIAAADDEKAEPAKPVSHTIRNIEGWTVEIDDRLLEEKKELGEISLRLLSNQLFQIAFLLPKSKVEKLQTVKIRLDLTHGKLTSAQYHPSRGWLRRNGYSESLAKCVHLPDAARFASKNLHRTQPWVMLHELAHAYHDQFLERGFEKPAIKEAWQKLVESGKYEKTLHIDGHATKHYALTDQMEFFAEFTESFFGMNDFFPFNRGELKKDAPEIEELLRRIWLDER